MDIEPQNYALSASHFNHHKAVRALDVLGPYMLSGSIDQTCQLFKKTTEPPHKFEFLSAITLFEDYILKVLIRPDLQGFIIGCKDNKIYLLDIEANPIGVLEGHTLAISSLCLDYIAPDKLVLASGSWDATARIWDIESRNSLYTLEGHSHAVAVLIYKQVGITGSQDGKLHFWNMETGKKIRTLEKAHTDIIRELTKVEAVEGFLSCSNDESFKLWTLEGELLHKFQGHESYVFSVKCLSFGKYVSASDDRTVKIWSQEKGCIQTIEHPNTVWEVAVDPSNEDIMTACADGTIRVFTKDLSRIAAEPELKEFVTSCEAAKNQMNPGMTQAELEKLPTIASQSKFVGKSDGEIRLFRNGALAEAFVWKAAEQVWDKIGDVISGNQRKYYEGDRYFEAGEYDYVFDVDIESQVASKMPYNEGDNPLETAEKFLAREGLNKGHITQITDFIKTNTRGINKGNKGASTSVFSGIESLVKKEKKENYKYFPTTEYLRFEGMNMQGLLKKTMENNEFLKGQGSKLAMSEKEAKYFNNILEILNNTKMYHSSQLTGFELDFFRNKLLNWPLEYKISIFDLLRIYLLHSQSEVLFSGLNAGLDILTDISGVLQGKAGANEPLIALCLRALTNMFIQVTNQNSMLKNSSIVLDSLVVVIPKYQTKANIMTACSNLLLNYAIALAINFEISEGEVKRYADILVEFLKCSSQSNSQILKGFVAIGTLLVSNKKNYIPIIKNQVSGFLKNFKVAVQDSESQKVEECWKDIIDYLI